MFRGSRAGVPKPAPRSLEDLDSVQRVLMQRSVVGRPGLPRARQRTLQPEASAQRHCPGKDSDGGSPTPEPVDSGQAGRLGGPRGQLASGGRIGGAEKTLPLSERRRRFWGPWPGTCGARNTLDTGEGREGRVRAP